MAYSSERLMFDHAPVTLTQRVFRAGGWTVAGLGLSQVIRFGSSLLMTRLLAPEMFGVMAIATMVMVGLALFSDLGLGLNVVQSKRGNEAAFLNTIWVLQILRGVVTWFFALGVSLLVVFANPIGMVRGESVYSEPSLPHVIAIFSISAIIWGFASSKMYEAGRNLAL